MHPEPRACIEYIHINHLVAFGNQAGIFVTMPRPRKLSIDQTLSLAKKATSQGKKVRAIQLYQSILRLKPQHPIAKHALLKLQGNSPQNQETQAATPSPENINEIIILYKSGKLIEAEHACRKELHVNPRSVTLLAILGSILRKQNRTEEALSKFNQALQLKPDFAEAYNNRGNALRQLGRQQEALDSFDKALQLKPDFAEAYNNRGLALRELGRMQEALDSYDKALQFNPRYTETHNNRGITLWDMGRLEKACDSFSRALQLNPEYAEAYNNRGNTLQKLGRSNDALDSYDKALQINPRYTEAHNNQGLALHELGRMQEALDSFDKALQLKPDFAEAHNNRGLALRELGQLEKSLDSFDNALQFDPQCVNTCYNRGNVLRKLGRLQEALDSFDKALQLKPDLAEAHNNRGLVLQDMIRLEEAEAAYRRALELKPDRELYFSNLLFLLNYAPDHSAEDIFAEYRAYDKRFGMPHRDQWRPHTRSRDPQRRLRIGYVSPDFSIHSTRFFLEPLLAQHNHDRFEIVAYAEVRKDDAMTKRYRGYIDHWVRTNELSDDELSERIRADGIDILVDLAGHTGKNRLGVFARKPAPVSVSWLGYGYTTGLTAIDYFLTDAATVPPDSEHLFSETPWRIDTPAFAYRPADGMGEVGPLPALQRGYITFGTLTRAVRINHRTIRVWSEILKRVNNSRLVINSTNFRDPTAQEALAGRFALEGIGAERLLIGFNSPPWDLLRSIDITLDCFPHNSGTTLFESLYMGIPFITLAGRPSVGRLGSSILQGAGHPEWIAHSEEEYADKAVALAGDPAALASIRDGLRDDVRHSSIMDEKAFARNVEHAYLQMFEQW